MAKQTAVFEPLAERVDWLARELELAIRWDRPSILLAVYSSVYVMNDAAAALEARLREGGQQVVWVRVNGEADADIPLRLAGHPQRNGAVFFVSGLQWGGQTALRALNIRREYFVDQRLRAVFWLTESEAVAIARQAPDFWAFRHRVVEFVEPPEPGQVAAVARGMAWWGLEDRTLRQDTQAKIALRETLLADLPEGDETLAARAELLRALGVLYWTDQQYERAEESFRAALEAAQRTDNTRLEAWCHNGLGTVYRDLGRYAEAVAEYQRAIALNPKDASYHNNLGIVYSNLGSHDQAIAELQQAVELDPKLAPPRKGLGTVYRDLGRYEEAVAEYRQAIALDPKDAYPHHALSEIYQDMGRSEDAFAESKLFVGLFLSTPQQREAFTLLLVGIVCYQKGLYDEAIAQLQHAIELEPKLVPPHLFLAMAYRKLGRETEYAEHIKLVRELMADKDDYDKACIEALAGNTEEALEWLARTLEKRPGMHYRVRSDPNLDFIRSDPRFQELIGESPAIALG